MKNISWVDGKDNQRRGLAEPIRQQRLINTIRTRQKKWILDRLYSERRNMSTREVVEGKMAGKTQRATKDNDARVDVRSYIKEQA